MLTSVKRERYVYTNTNTRVDINPGNTGIVTATTIVTIVVN